MKLGAERRGEIACGRYGGPRVEEGHTDRGRHSVSECRNGRFDCDSGVDGQLRDTSGSLKS
jgi:hypothetical protein